jgi:hypothetical protein
MLPGRLLGLSPNTPRSGGLAHHHVHHPFGYFFYVKMSFGLKNAGATH